MNSGTGESDDDGGPEEAAAARLFHAHGIERRGTRGER
jgi:hypothetical protein